MLINPAMPQLLYMDNQLLVVSKPFNLPVEPGDSEAEQDCLLSRLDEDFPGLLPVQPLAAETSGIMLLALTAESQQTLTAQFATGAATRSYQALLTDALPEAEGRNETFVWQTLPGGEDEHRVQLTMTADLDSQLPEILQTLGAAIIGTSYSDEQRLLLHGWDLSFNHPNTGQRMEFRAPCPF